MGVLEGIDNNGVLLRRVVSLSQRLQCSKGARKRIIRDGLARIAEQSYDLEIKEKVEHTLYPFRAYYCDVILFHAPVARVLTLGFLRFSQDYHVLAKRRLEMFVD